MNIKEGVKGSYILSIILGTAVMAVGVQCIYDRVGLVTGGFLGLAIVIRNITGYWVSGGIPLWVTNFMLNIPVFLVGYFRMGKKFLGRSILGTILLSLWLYVLPPIDLAQGDFLLAALFGGICSGVGMGLVFRGMATTGGTDMVAALIQKSFPHYSVAQIMQVVDGVVVLLGLFVFGIRASLYAVVAIFVTTKMSDGMLSGFGYSKAVYIVTEHYQEVASRIMEELDRGITGISARGMYTNQEKCLLYCVVSKKEVFALKEIVHDTDKKAFIIVEDVREVLGEGFPAYPNGISG